MQSETNELISSGRFAELIFELLLRTSCELPADVERALQQALLTEEEGSTARLILSLFLENIKLARTEKVPLCQDTGMPLFFIRHPENVSQPLMARAVRESVIRATEAQLLRPNAVDPVTGKNSGNNLGEGFPGIYFMESEEPLIEVSLILKGGGSENVSAQYSLPHTALNAGRDMEGVRRVVLNAVRKAEGKGCPPGVLGVCLGGDRASGYAESKRQLLRRLDDVNPDPLLAELEQRLLYEANELGIGPLGLGGESTLLGVKIGKLHRLPASYFVTVSYMCWEHRRRTLRLTPDGTYSVI
ncbi:MAG: fumarate hydratase [Syntrophales bacterium]|nr:fumarate hydratase [Syntrophales bacterium]